MDVIGQVYDRLLGGSVIVLAVLIILSIIRSGLELRTGLLRLI